MKYAKPVLGFAFFVLCNSAFAQTSFYQCKDEYDRPIFSQRPCGDDAEQKQISGAPVGSSTTEVTEKPHSEDVKTSTVSQVKETKSSWDRIEASNRIREIEREMSRRENTIKSYENRRDNELLKLQNKKRYANNNLAGATWEESISSEMRAVNEKYESKLEREEKKIDRLINELERLEDDL